MCWMKSALLFIQMGFFPEPKASDKIRDDSALELELSFQTESNQTEVGKPFYSIFFLLWVPAPPKIYSI